MPQEGLERFEDEEQQQWRPDERERARRQEWRAADESPGAGDKSGFRSGERERGDYDSSERREGEFGQGQFDPDESRQTEFNRGMRREEY